MMILKFPRIFPVLLIVILLFADLGPIPSVYASVGDVILPMPGTMVNLSPAYEPALLKGLTVHKDNPFLFDFILDTGNSQLTGNALRQEGNRLVKYFFACLTIPEKDLWVNLSPYEKDRMVPAALGETAMGKDLLAQDYILKQLTASLIYPEKVWVRIFGTGFMPNRVKCLEMYKSLLIHLTRCGFWRIKPRSMSTVKQHLW